MRRRSTAALLLLLVAPLGAPLTGPASAQTTASACPDGAIGDSGFRDLGGSVHRAAVDCAVHWEVAHGRTPTKYEPAGVVTRAQAASFVARLLLESGATLPDASGNTFSDDDGSVHEESIERLAEAGVVSGRGPGRYAPTDPVTRAQAASLLVRAYDLRAEQAGQPPLPEGSDAFRDDDGHVLERDIDRAAAAGIVAGRSDGRFVPGGSVFRDALASFLARTLDAVVRSGMAEVPPAPVLPVAVVAVGDIACEGHEPVTPTQCQHRRTAATTGSIDPHAVLLLGDIQYDNGSVEEFSASGGWNGTWSAFLDRTWPAPGNHEWYTAGAAGYRSVFDERTGGSFWYSRDLGGWHVVSLDSDCDKVGGCHDGSPQHEWLEQDLAANDGRPTLVFWHHPRYSSGDHGNQSFVDPLWRAAVADRDVQLVLTGHDHSYERFAPLNADGVPDGSGVRSFVVGTGGKSLYCDRSSSAPSEVFDCSSSGVLSLVLREDGYDWEFVRSTGSFTDSGSSGLRPAA